MLLAIGMALFILIYQEGLFGCNLVIKMSDKFDLFSDYNGIIGPLGFYKK